VSVSSRKYQRIAADVKLGRNVRIYDFTKLYGCEIGDDVKIGNRCKVSSHTFICERVVLEDDVFIGHNVPSGAVVAGNPARVVRK
jgi:acetyltransferase-like isoleucine patch superfamily enzyme